MHETKTPMHILTEDVIGLTEARNVLRRGVCRPGVATVWRWAFKGLGKDRVRLETIKLGGQHFTSVQACTRFIERLNRPSEN